MFAMAGAVLIAAAGVGEATGAVKAVQNSLRVNGIKASKTPKPNQLLPLNSKGRFPASVLTLSGDPKTTYTGVISVEGTAPGAIDEYGYGATLAQPFYVGTSITLPYAAKGIESGDASVQGGGIENPGCEGTFEKPTAGPGLLCIYPGHEVDAEADIDANAAEILNILKNGEGAIDATPYMINGGKQGVRLEVRAAAAGPVRFSATWAYQPAK
jgi:hypothetical protein